VRVWRDLKQLKRSGRIHDPAGVAAMRPGELADKCPACPDPDLNLEKGWENTPEEDLYVTLPTCTDTHLITSSWHNKKIYALDACMKLSMKQGSQTKRSTNDPYPSSGAGVFTNDEEFREFLRKYGHLGQV
jgi:hypothetical protein